MTIEISTDGITGSDGQTPIYDPDGLWKTWSINEIYFGLQGEKRYVPKADDHVIDPSTNVLRQVVSIDPTTLIPTLKPVTLGTEGEFGDTDVLLGVGPGTQSDTYRVYINQSVIPHQLAVDARLKVAGSMVASCKIFRGSLLTGTAEVVSAFYDQSGNLLGQSIPLELVASTGNVSIRTVPVCYTSFDLPDGEIVTAVFYSDTGHVVSKRQLLVENTGFIRSTDVGVKYITGISLESPFLSSSDPLLIQYPLNVPLNGLSLIGIVTYSDGTTLRMPVDGTKFEIFGFVNFVSTIIGQKFNLVLKYSLSSDELVYGATISNDKFITQTYKAVTTQAEGAFTVKIFGYPVWIDAVNGYRMQWYMYNLDRDVVYNITPYVQFNDATRIFDPTAYGIIQNLSVSVNLKDVNGAFTSYIHTQSISITLVAPGTTRTTNWTIGFDPGQNPQYGVNNAAKTTFVNSNLMKVKVDCEASTLNDWLQRLYFRTKPLSDPAREIAPPTPDFFKFVLGNTEVEFPVSQWNQEQIINTVLPNSSTLFIKFFKRTADSDLELAVCGIPVYQQN